MSKNPSAPTSPKKLQDNSELEFALERAFPDLSTLLLPYSIPQSSDASVMVAFDTNVLLLPYSLGQKNLKGLFTSFSALADAGRLFIPARALREFVRRRDEKLAELVKNLTDRCSKELSMTDDIPHLLEDLPAYTKLKAAAEQLKNASKDYRKASDEIIDAVKEWKGNDPVSVSYRKLFTDKVVIDHDCGNSQLSQEWEIRRRDKRPPGYKDAAKDDTGIGDYLIWKALLKLGETHKKDLVFVSGEQKSDWFVRANHQHLYPRPELIDEYRRASRGKNIRISTLQSLLSEIKADAPLVEAVKIAEDRANTDILIANTAHDSSRSNVSLRAPLFGRSKSFDYSTNNGVIGVGGSELPFALKFSKADDKSVHFYRVGDTVNVARLRSVLSSQPISLMDFDTSSQNYTIQKGECFAAQNRKGDILVARLIDVRDDTRGAERDEVTFVYNVFPAGVTPIAP